MSRIVNKLKIFLELLFKNRKFIALIILLAILVLGPQLGLASADDGDGDGDDDDLPINEGGNDPGPTP